MPPVLSVRDLTIRYRTRQGMVNAVEDVTFDVESGQSVGIVGESGSGKSTVAMALLRLLPENAVVASGQIVVTGSDILPMREDDVRLYRWDKIAMIFQASMNSLDPVYTVGNQIAEAVLAHRSVSRNDAMNRAEALLETVAIGRNYLHSYPHELSGGMKQRAIIAMALACDPDVLVADEPTTALDVIVQDTILSELRHIQQNNNMGMVYVSHDISLVESLCDLVGVMYGGRLVEFGAVEDVFNNPIHPYTRGLIDSVPNVTGPKREVFRLPGNPPDLIDPPLGCRFHPRCAFASETCSQLYPPLAFRNGQRAHCWNPIEAGT